MKHTNTLLVALLLSATLFAATQKTETSLINNGNGISSEKFFMQNKGQIIDQNEMPNTEVKFLMALNGLNVQLKTNSFSYDAYKQDEDGTRHFHRIDVELVGANLHPKIEASEPSTTYFNFYTTGTPEEGVTNVRYYKQVLYRNIYEGIDLVFKPSNVNGKSVEYDFIVHPGADASKIKLKYIGALSTKITNDKLILKLAHGSLEEFIPKSFLAENGEEVAVSYSATEGNNTVISFHTNNFDRSKTLIIDPVVVSWGTYYGGSNTDVINACSATGLYHAGYSNSTNNIATSGAHQTTLAGNNDGILLSISAGGVLQWATYLGGSQADQFNDIAHSGTSIFVGGRTMSTGLSTSGVFQLTNNGSGDGLIARFTTAGVRTWCTYFGGTGDDEITGIGFDTDVFVHGRTQSASGIATTGTHQTALAATGQYDAFVSQVANTGSSKVWATYYGGTGAETAKRLAVNFAAGYVAVVGLTASSSGIASTGAFKTTISGATDGYIAVFNSSNGTRTWGTYYGSANVNDIVNDCVLQGGTTPYLYFVGTTPSITSTSGIASSGAFQTVPAVNTSAFIGKFTLATGVRQWCTFYGDEGTTATGIQFAGSELLIGGNSINLADATAALFNVNSYCPSGAPYLATFTQAGARVGNIFRQCAANTVLNDVAYENGSLAYYMVGETASNLNGSISGGTPIHQASVGGAVDGFIVRFVNCIAPAQPGPITGAGTACQGSSQTYSIAAVSGATGYTWTLPNGWSGTSATTSITATVGAAGGTVSVTANNACGSSPVRTLAVTVTALPAQPGTITGNTSVCQSSSQTYSIAAVTGATSYTWTLPSGWSGTSATNSITATAGTTGGTISVTANNACGSSPVRTLSVTSTALPAQPGAITGAGTVCQGSSQTYTIAAVSGATSYTWTLPSGWSGTSTSTSIPATVGASGGNLSVVANNACGSGPARTIAVTVNPVPAQPGVISGATTVCQGSSQTYSIAAVSGANSYTWTLPNGWTGTSTSTSIPATVGANGGTISVVANNNCGAGTARTLAVTVSPTPAQPGTISGNTTVCQTSSQTYSIAAVSGATSYTWTLPSGWSGTSTTNSITPTVGASGGNITVTANNACGSSTAQTLSINVTNTPPQPGTITGSNLVCAGSQQTYSIAAVSGATSYTWTLPSGWSGTSSTTSIIATVGTQDGTISVVANNACGASAPRNLSVFVNTVPAQPSTITGGNTACKGATQTYSVANVSGVTYAWNAPGGTVSGNGNSVNITWNTAGAQTITVTPSNSCGNGTARTLNVTVNDVPAQPGTISGLLTVCQGSSQTYSIAAVSGATSYTWTLPSGWSGTSTANSISPTVGANGGTISVTANNACGSSTAQTATVVVTNTPSQPSTITGSTTVCSGTTQTYSVSSVAGVTYTWNATGGTVSGSGNSVSITWNTAGTQTITVTPSNSCGSGTARTLSVTVNSGTALGQPGAISGATTVCSGTSQTYSIAAVSGATSYTWTLPNGWTGTSTSTSIPTTVGSNSGTVSVVANNSCGSGTAQTLNVTVNNVPAQPSTITGSTSPCVNTAYTYSVTNVSGVTYSWSASGGTVTGSGNSVSINFNTAGIQTITVTPSSNCGTGTARTLSVSVGSAPVQPGTITGSNLVCAGSQQTYSIAAVSGATSYTWTLPSGYSGTSTTTSINATIGSADGTISVVANNACGASAPRNLSVFVNTVPAQPSTIVGGNSSCVGVTQTYSVTNVSGVTYTWNVTGGTVSGTGNSVSITWNTAGAQTITVTPSNTCGTGTPRVLNINIASAPAQPGAISGNSTVCEGSSQTYSISLVSGASGYSWTLPAGWIGNSVLNSITATAGAASGNITVFAVNSCGSSATQTFAVTVNNTPAQPSVITGSTTVCAGTTQTYSVTNVNGVTYAWNATGGTVSGSGNSVSITWNTAGTQTITVTPSNSCGTGTARTLSVTVNSGTALGQPGAISGLTHPCAGVSITYNIAAVSGASSYTWTLPNGWTGTSTSTFIPVTVGTNSGIVSVVANNSCGSSTAQTLSVTVNTVPPQPGIISGNANVCVGSSQTYSVAPVAGANAYVWTLPAGWNDSSTNSSISAIAGSSGGVISVAGANLCGAGIAQTLNVSVLNVPTQPGTISGNATVCQGSLQTYSVAAVNGASSYTWTLPNGWTGNSTTNTISPTVNANSGTISVTANNSCGSSTAQTLSVTASANPTANISPASVAICEGASATLTASGGAFYAWSNSGGSSAAATFSPTSNTTYTVTVTNAANCSATATRLVTVNANPTATINPSSASICAGASQSLTASGGNGYTWSNSLGSGATKSVSPTQTTTYTVTVSNANNCTAIANATITVNTVNASINGPTTICSGLQATLTASGGNSYAWSNSLGTSASVTVSPSSTTTYTVTVTGTGNCTATASQTVSVQSQPTAVINGPSTVCAGSSVTLTANGGNTYTWANGLGTNASITVSPTAATTYTVTVSIGANCTATASKTVNIAQATSSQMAQTICSGGSYNFGGNTLTQSGTYTDVLVNAAGCDSTVTLNLTVLAPIASTVNASICQGGSYNFNGSMLTNAGTYTQTLQGASAQGCDSSVTLNLTVGSFIVSNISKTICAGESFVFNGKTLTQSGVYADTLTTASCDSIVNLTLTVNTLPQPTVTQNGNVLSTQSFASYQWQVGGNDINNATAQNYTATQSGNYAVVVTDANGCSNTSSALNVTISTVSEILDFRTVIYPNPTSSVLNVESDEEIQSIQVADVTGRIIITQSNLATRTSHLATDFLAEATYFIRITTTNGKTAVKSFVKQ
ncbi:MAG: T9SS type A sorting domain-containing protein [Chitinophagales bacterium]|nr:T9SS type A sorting domain-containing protein [Chitinophagales bacterium]